MSYGDMDDMAKITISNLIKTIVEERKEARIDIHKIAKDVESYVLLFKHGRIMPSKRIIYRLNDALAILSGDWRASTQLESAILSLEEHLERKKPIPATTSALLTNCQQALTVAIKGHFNALQRQINAVILAVLGNTTLMKKHLIVPEDFNEALHDVRESRMQLEDNYS